MADLPTATEQFINGILPENPVYRQLLGWCTTLAVTNSLNAAITMAGAVGFVLLFANVITRLIRNLLKPHLRTVIFTLTITTFVLMPGAPLTRLAAGLFMQAETAARVELTILSYIVYIFTISAPVQFVEMYVRRFFPMLYKACGVFLPLIITNCAILFACLTIMSHVVDAENPADRFDLGRALNLALFGGVGLL